MKNILIAAIFIMSTISNCYIAEAYSKNYEITIKDILSQGGIERETIDGIYFYKSPIEENGSFSTSISDKDDIDEFYEKFIKLPLNDTYDSLNTTYIKITFAEHFDNNDQVIYQPDGFYYWNVDMEERKVLYKLYISADDVIKILEDMNYRWHENIGGGDGKITGVPIKDTIQFTIDSPIYIVNGIEKQIDKTNKNVVPFIDEKADRTLVPLRAIGEVSGYAVEWTEDEQKVTLSQNDRQIELFIGKADIKVRTGDDEPEIIETDSAPVIVEERTFLPLRIIAELMGYEVDWKEVTQEIILQRKQ